VGIAVVVVRFLPLESMGIALSETPAFPAGAAIAGVAISTSIGALCGIIPALAAVRIKPIDAIRY
jgi:putative efflux ABC transporter, permease protein